MLSSDGRYAGKLYRAIPAKYANEPLSGEGARQYGGRFNPKGIPALYTALSRITAQQEANQRAGLQPVTVVSFKADIGPVFDACDADALGRYDMDFDKLASAWDDDMFDVKPVPTQAFAQQLIADGYAGMLVRSFTKNTTEADLNLVLWKWTGEGCSLEVVDDGDGLERS